MQGQLDRWSLMWRICGLAALGVMLGLGINRAAADSACITNVADMMQLMVDAGSDCGCDCREPLAEVYLVTLTINSDGANDGGTVTFPIHRSETGGQCEWHYGPILHGPAMGDGGNWEIGGALVYQSDSCWEMYIVAYYINCSEGTSNNLNGGFAFSDEEHPNPKGTYSEGYVQGLAACTDDEHDPDWIRSYHPWNMTDIIIEKYPFP